MRVLNNENYTVTKSDGHRIIVLSKRTLTANRTVLIDGAEVGRELTIATENPHVSYYLTIDSGNDRIGGGTDTYLSALGQSLTLRKTRSGLWLPTHGMGISRTGGEVDESGATGGVVTGQVYAALEDGVATRVFSINTSDLTGDVDGGGFGCIVEGIVTNGASSGASASVCMHFRSVCNKVQIATGSDYFGTPSAYTVTSPKAVSNAASRDIGTLTTSFVAINNYSAEFRINIAHSGSAAAALAVFCEVKVIHRGYKNAPRIVK